MSENKSKGAADNEGADVKRTGHVYDGIEELDHAPPTWFMLMFYAGIVFGIGYFFYYVIGDGPTLTKEYERARNAEEYAQYELAAKSGGPKTLAESDLKALLKDEGKKKAGLASFQSKCASCHGNQGQGGIGPNLTDAYWIHGGKMTEVLAVITKGVPDKGMPPWGPILSAEEVQALTVHVRTLAGTRPPGAKEPQGTLVKAE
jgi:cytochrome c oxidase cbb3-type subunit 3